MSIVFVAITHSSDNHSCICFYRRCLVSILILFYARYLLRHCKLWFMQWINLDFEFIFLTVPVWKHTSSFDNLNWTVSCDPVLGSISQRLLLLSYLLFFLIFNLRMISTLIDTFFSVWVCVCLTDYCFCTAIFLWFLIILRWRYASVW